MQFVNLTPTPSSPRTPALVKGQVPDTGYDAIWENGQIQAVRGFV